MTVGGSQNLRRYRIARRDGATMHTACVMSGIGMSEARLIDAEDRRNPPPPEAFELLGGAPEPITNEAKEDEMARGRKAKPISGEVPKPDFEMGVKIYREDIKSAMASQGEFGQELSTAYKAIKKNAHLHPGAAKQAFALDRMEEAKRDDWLRTFSGLLKEMKIFMPSDLVDQAEGKGEANANVVPIGERAAPQLATIPNDDSDLAGDADPAIAAE